MNFLTPIVCNTSLTGKSKKQAKLAPSLLLCFLLLFGFNANANAKSVLVKSSFLSKPTDAYSFVKNQLTYQGFRKAISNELKAMGLNSDLFWQKYNLSFEELFEKKDLALKKRYKIPIIEELADNPNELDPAKKVEKKRAKVSASNQRNYDQKRRQARLSSLSRFGNLSKVITQFTVQKTTRSTRNPHQRYMKLDIKVNRRHLQSLYQQFVANNKSQSYERIIVHTELSIENANWEDVGVSNKKVLQSALVNSWRKWFQNNYSELSNLIEFDFAEKSQEQEIISSDSNSEVGSEKITEDLNQVEDTPIKDVLIISLEAKVRKTFDDDLEKFRGFSLNIFMNAKSLREQRLLSSQDVFQDSSKFSTLESKELSSNIASAIYNLPLKALGQMKLDIYRMQGMKYFVDVNYKHFPFDLIDLSEKIEEVGVSMGMKSKVERFGKTKSLLSLFLTTNELSTDVLISKINQTEYFRERKIMAKFNQQTKRIVINGENKKTIK